MDQAWEKSWPFWKFGLKSNDLTTTLHEKYNTISFSIQDPDAFHHDVFEISHRASTLADFEGLMQERKALRVKELNDMLEDASFEIVGNPDLIGTEQWALAVQLFRTRSLDSLVRYFASYLPADHPWHHEPDSSVESSVGEARSPIDYDGPSLFDEPDTISECFSVIDPIADQPVRSMSIRSEDSGVSVGERFKRARKSKSHSQSSGWAVSVFDYEPDRSSASLQNSLSLGDEGTSLTHYPETPISISDMSDGDYQDNQKDLMLTSVVDDDSIDGYLSISHTSVASLRMDSETPTPKAEVVPSDKAPAPSSFETKSKPTETKSSPMSCSHTQHTHPAFTGPRRPDHQITTRRTRRREESLDRAVLNRRVVSKPHRARQVSPDVARSRARARRRQVT